MVQLPEPLEQTRTLGDGTILATIASIGRVRIRRLTAKLLADQGRQLDLDGGAIPEDLGMRIFRLAESTMRVWEPMPPETTPDAYVEQLMLFNDLLLPGWQPEDVIWEVALKEGLSLSSTLTRVMEVADLTVWRVTDRDKDQSLLICLDDQVTVEAFRPLKLTQEDVLICRDSALDDVTAVNLALQCRLKTI
jgi:adenine-specific DNA-methyltransferase